ncbi:MAG TPA: hypothetical protein VGE51_04845 [Fontimonas sp.]
MAYKPRAVDLKLREQRLQLYQTARSISSSFPALEHISLQVRFSGADRLSPYRQIYTGDMQAYFILQCPSRDCEGGGFDLTRAITAAAKSASGIAAGTAACSGALATSGRRGDACPVTLNYDVDCVRRD